MTPILTDILKMIYRDGVKPVVTLIAHGKTMSGYLSASDYYMQWQTENINRATLGKGHFRLPSTDLPRLPDALIDDLKPRWPERDAEFASRPELAETLYLRNAKVYEPAAPQNWAHPFIVVMASAVTAIALGIIGSSAYASSS